MVKKPPRSRNQAKQVKFDPRVVYQEGVSKFQSGAIKEARSLFKKLAKGFPDVADSYYFLSLIASQEQDYHEASKQVRQALKINSANPAVVCQWANILRLKGEYAKAEKQYQKVIELDASHVEAWINLGMTLKLLGNYKDAIEAYEKAIEINPNIAEVYNNLGNIFLAQGNNTNASDYFQKAIEKNPYFSGAYFNLTKSFLNLSEFEKSLEVMRKAVKLDQENELFIRELAQVFSQVRIRERDESIEKDLLLCLVTPKEDAWRFGQTVADYLMEYTPLKDLFDFISAQKTFSINNVDHESLLQILLLNYLSNQQSCNIKLEKLLTQIRRQLLFDCVSGEVLNYFSELESFINALASQCFINEYVFYETEEERIELSKIEKEIFNDNNEVNIPKLLVFSCYQPMFRHAQKAELLVSKNKLPGSLKALIKQQLLEPEQEFDLRDSIHSLGVTNDKISKIVRQQYEENPYPRWFDVELPEPKPMKAFLQDLFPYLEPGSLNFPNKMEILVAGCGTGLQPIKNARYFPESHVIGIDLSLSSLSYAKRMLKELKVNNVDLYQADILELEKTQWQFDFVECYGVLHHMDDPFLGWKKLYAQLKAGGVMRIALYSHKARATIRLANQFIKDNQFVSNPDGIRECRKAIMQLPDTHELRAFDHSPDFYTLSECRDLIFHVNEHQLDITYIQDAIEEMILRFLGFELDNRLALADFKKQYSDIQSLSNLELWDEFEATHPATFASQYVFWVQKL